MATSLLVRRYARSLLAAAQGANAAELVGRELDRFADLLAADPEIGRLLNHPLVSETTHRELLAKFADPQTPAVFNDFIVLLLRKRGTLSIRQLALEYRILALAAAGEALAEVIVPRPLPADQKERLQAALNRQTGRRVILEEKVEPRLLGGIMVKIGDRVWDGSLSYRLAQLTGELAG